MSTSSTWSAARTTASGTVSRCGTPVIFSTTSLSDSRCWTLTGGDHVDAGVEQLLDVLPALLVPRAGDVGVRELVDERDLRAPGEHRVDVHLLERRAAVRQLGRGDDLQPVEQRGGLRPAVRLDERDHHVGAALRAAVPLAEHGVRLADPGGGAEVDPQVPASRPGGLAAVSPAVVVRHLRPVSCSACATSLVKHARQAANSTCHDGQPVLTGFMRRANALHARRPLTVR